MPVEVSMMAAARKKSTGGEGAAEGWEEGGGAREEVIEAGAAGPGQPDSSRPDGGRRRKRIRHFTPNDRAAHRVFERSRREAFRQKLVELAALVPSLADTDPGRLSKHMVIHASIARHQEQQRVVQGLARERDALLDEVNRWRDRAGLARRLAEAPLASPGAALPGGPGLVWDSASPPSPPPGGDPSGTAPPPPPLPQPASEPLPPPPPPPLSTPRDLWPWSPNLASGTGGDPPPVLAWAALGELDLLSVSPPPAPDLGMVVTGAAVLPPPPQPPPPPPPPLTNLDEPPLLAADDGLLRPPLESLFWLSS